MPSEKPVLIYIGSESSVERGAIGTHTAGIVNGLAGSGRFEKTFFIGGGPAAETKIPLNTTGSFLLDIDVAASRTVAGRMLRRYRILREIVRKVKRLFDECPGAAFVVYTRYSLLSTYFILWLLAKVFKRHHVKLVTEYNDISIDQLRFVSRYQTKFITRLLRTNPFVVWFLGFSEARIFSSSSLTVVTTDKIGEYARRLAPGCRALVLPNAASSDLIRRARATDKIAARKELGLDPGPFYLAHVGTFTYWDGLDCLLKGISRCRQKADLRLIIVGFGDALEMTKALAKELGLANQVLFFPPQPHEKAFSFLLASDAVPIIKTIDTYQLSPIKYYESLAAGKPMICTDIPYINEIGRFKFGRVVACPPSPDSVASAIDEFYLLRDSLESWKPEILDYAERNHTWDIRAVALLKALANGL
ncbi:MAG TPA: glycosyltransferase [Chitinivibrionales bacterium]|nr:glycosyltransferase [Chitinivibrionales bacterium]